MIHRFPIRRAKNFKFKSRTLHSNPSNSNGTKNLSNCRPSFKYQNSSNWRKRQTNRKNKPIINIWQNNPSN